MEANPSFLSEQQDKLVVLLREERVAAETAAERWRQEVETKLQQQRHELEAKLEQQRRALEQRQQESEAKLERVQAEAVDSRIRAAEGAVRASKVASLQDRL
eukprot:COSAG02_NODE_31183_length_538_cov_0.612756_2_plen_101_part_01